MHPSLHETFNNQPPTPSTAVLLVEETFKNLIALKLEVFLVHKPILKSKLREKKYQMQAQG